MKITAVKTILVNPGHRVSWGTGYGKNWVFVKIETDSGLHGIGEAFGTCKDKSTEAAVGEYERWLVGKSPEGIIRHWQAMFRGDRYPPGTPNMAALSAIEQALWDIAGKRCGLPVYKMLGGPCRDRIRLYASSAFFWSWAKSDRDSMADVAKRFAESGFTAVKFNASPDDFACHGAASLLAASVERIRAVREAVGDGMDICLDYHGRSLSPSDAIRLAKAIEPYHPFFLEEPALSEFPASLAEVKAKTSIPIAAGERCVSRQQTRELLEARAIHIFQPEPTANGGILETIKQAAYCELLHILIAPHHACSPVSLVACAHIDACLPNFLIQEFNCDPHSPCARDVIVNPPRIVNGHLELPDGPGLGIDLNEEACRDYPFKPSDRPVPILSDGAVGLE